MKMTIHSFDDIKDRVCLKLINSTENQELLDAVPSQCIVEDIYAIFFVLVEVGENSIASFTITNDLQQTLAVTSSTLYEAATKNMPGLFNAKVMPLTAVLKKMLGLGADDPVLSGPSLPLYVVTNDLQMFGASAMLYPELMESFADEVGEDFYILPSSIHEVLFLPESTIEDATQLTNMVREVNDTIVAPNEVLSSHAFHFNHRSRAITLAGKE